MLELIQTFSISEIIIFAVLLCLAIKGCVDFFIWAYNLLKQKFNKDNKEENLQAKIIQQEQQIQALTENIQEVKKDINLLLVSDRNDIKAWITERHHYFCYKQKFIDDYSLDCLEKRYACYEQEHGNSFVKDLMEDLRKLPRISNVE